METASNVSQGARETVREAREGLREAGEATSTRSSVDTGPASRRAVASAIMARIRSAAPTTLVTRPTPLPA